MTYKTIHTSNGLVAMAQAEATGTPINLTHMAVGDGSGNAVEPAETQSNLVRELYRAAPNRIWQDPDVPNKFTAELVIPASVGGFVLREVGVFDASGSLFVVGNLPDTYKPQTSDGAYADTVVRVDFMVTNASVVTIMVDPNVAVATQQWVSNNVTACTILPGGTTGQVLVKKSNDCGDVEWRDATDANVVVDVIEEKQTLAADQTVVTLATVTTRGLAVYIEGVRLDHAAGAGGWQEDATYPDTKIVLGKSYHNGTAILLVQNEPLGTAPYPLQRELNLSDLENAATARQNLDVFSKAEARQMAPAGAVMHFARSTAPTGWLKANGAAVSRAAYADLFAAIGTTFGAGDGFNTFNLPDLRGEFVRGWDDGRGADAGRALGSAQAAQFASHSHQLLNALPAPDGSPTGRYVGAAYTGVTTSANAGSYSETAMTSTGGTETRPRNVALLACIKF